MALEDYEDNELDVSDHYKKRYKSMIFCEHANEGARGGLCRCPSDCGCKEKMCFTNKAGSPTVVGARIFASGATRNNDVGKPDYFGFTSALVTKRFGEYMLKHRKQEDGSLRDSDNWKKGFPEGETVRSLSRHVEDVKLHLEGFPSAAVETLEEALCAVIFNAQSMLFEILKKKEGK